MVLLNRISMVQIISCLRLPSSFPSTFPWEHETIPEELGEGKLCMYVCYWTMFWKTQVQEVFWLLNFMCTKGLQIDSLKHITDLLLEYFIDSTSGPEWNFSYVWLKRICALISVGLRSSLGLLAISRISHSPCLYCPSGHAFLAVHCFTVSPRSSCYCLGLGTHPGLRSHPALRATWLYSHTSRKLLVCPWVWQGLCCHFWHLLWYLLALLRFHCCLASGKKGTLFSHCPPQ